MNGDLFLLERAFDDCLERLCDIRRRPEHALLIGCPSPRWVDKMKRLAREVDVVDPGGVFAARSGGIQAEEDRHDFGQGRYDLCVAIGTLDSVNDLPVALQLIGRSLRADAALIGAVAGGDSLPALRAALIEAGRRSGRIVARAHPRVSPSSLAQLLTAAGFAMPVVDVDRVKLRYPNFDALVRDLRGMSATSVLAQRPPPMSKAEAGFAREAFRASEAAGPIDEIVEILHFIAWADQSRQPAR